jgi:predicted DNA-binding transcriptional regulator AlpA
MNTKPQRPIDRLLNPDEVAERLGIQRQTLANLRCQKRGPAFVRLSAGAVRYRESAIERFIIERTVETAPVA